MKMVGSRRGRFQASMRRQDRPIRDQPRIHEFSRRKASRPRTRSRLLKVSVFLKISSRSTSFHTPMEFIDATRRADKSSRIPRDLRDYRGSSRRSIERPTRGDGSANPVPKLARRSGKSNQSNLRNSSTVIPDWRMIFRISPNVATPSLGVVNRR